MRSGGKVPPCSGNLIPTGAAHQGFRCMAQGRHELWSSASAQCRAIFAKDQVPNPVVTLDAPVGTDQPQEGSSIEQLRWTSSQIVLGRLLLDLARALGRAGEFAHLRYPRK